MVGHGRPGGEVPCLHRLAATQLQLINAVEGEADPVLPRFPKQRTENNLDFYLKSLDSWMLATFTLKKNADDSANPHTTSKLFTALSIHRMNAKTPSTEVSRLRGQTESTRLLSLPSRSHQNFSKDLTRKDRDHRKRDNSNAALGTVALTEGS